LEREKIASIGSPEEQCYLILKKLLCSTSTAHISKPVTVDDGPNCANHDIVLSFFHLYPNKSYAFGEEVNYETYASLQNLNEYLGNS
jgi:hypothetical protein